MPHVSFLPLRAHFLLTVTARQNNNKKARFALTNTSALSSVSRHQYHGAVPCFQRDFFFANERATNNTKYKCCRHSVGRWWLEGSVLTVSSSLGVCFRFKFESSVGKVLFGFSDGAKTCCVEFSGLWLAWVWNIGWNEWNLVEELKSEGVGRCFWQFWTAKVYWIMGRMWR